MAKVNYKQQKRQKELARKSRQDEKLQKRTAQPGATNDAGQAGQPDAAQPASADPRTT
jgi:ribosome assembly protein YihI (activator of Der GTPase)